jgi:hypothetical protein
VALPILLHGNEIGTLKKRIKTIDISLDHFFSEELPGTLFFKTKGMKKFGIAESRTS